ncbi:MAG TPA: hypothetical protein DCX06_14285 [Opitutae bacterium]|nr:hypothetical protein [Opitutae bacterium]
MKHTYIVLIAIIMPLFASAFDGIQGLGVTITTAKPYLYESPSVADAEPGMVVEVEIAVNAEGIVDAAYVLRADAPGFEASVLDSVMDWRFTPAMKNGKPVRTNITIPFRVVDAPTQIALD